VPSSRDESTRIAVASRSFSRHEQLRGELLARFSQVTFNDAGEPLAGDRLVDFLRGNERAIIALETVDESLLAKLPELRVISKYGVGLDNLDLTALARHGVRLGWRRGVNSRSVAELVIAMTLISLRHLNTANAEVREGKWRQHVGPELRGRVIGVVGLGSVGKEVAKLFQAFDCKVLSHDLLEMDQYCSTHGILQSSLDDLLAQSDIVTLHIPFDASTKGMFHRERLDLLKPGAILINTARGGIVDEAAVQTMLESGRLAAAAFDVFGAEPPRCTDLLNLPNFFATPHLGGSSVEAILAMGRAAIDGLDSATDARSFASNLPGEPQRA
jgi:phosphoglycerate dehydrogenase-like enzyme